MVELTTGVAGPRLRVAVVDAQPMFRAGVIHTLRSFKIVDMVAEGDNATDALRIAERHEIDIMLLDLHVAGGGSDAIASLARMWPAMRIVVLTSSEREEDVAASMQSGVRGYVLKNVDGQELFKALRSVATGGVYLTPALGARLFARPAPSAKQDARDSGLSDLTAREEEILSQVSVGRTNKEIARELDISEKTVKYYMTSIMQKLQVRNRVEAVVVARERVKKSA